MESSCGICWGSSNEQDTQFLVFLLMANTEQVTNSYCFTEVRTQTKVRKSECVKGRREFGQREQQVQRQEQEQDHYAGEAEGSLSE